MRFIRIPIVSAWLVILSTQMVEIAQQWQMKAVDGHRQLLDAEDRQAAIAETAKTLAEAHEFATICAHETWKDSLEQDAIVYLRSRRDLTEERLTLMIQQLEHQYVDHYVHIATREQMIMHTRAKFDVGTDDSEQAVVHAVRLHDETKARSYVGLREVFFDEQLAIPVLGTCCEAP